MEDLQEEVAVIAVQGTHYNMLLDTQEGCVCGCLCSRWIFTSNDVEHSGVEDSRTDQSQKNKATGKKMDKVKLGGARENKV